MGRPKSITLFQILQALQGVDAKPSFLAVQFGVSRQTLHRQLKKLHDAQLIERVGTGPLARYRLLPLFPVLTANEISSSNSPWVITMGIKGARLLQRALEWYARVGLGQIQVFGELLRDSRLDWSGANNMESMLRVLDAVDFSCQAIKRESLGLGTGSSLGIHNAHLPAAIRDAWVVQSAVRHRLAWDWTTELNRSHQGVWHDDPLDPASSVRVFSKDLPLDENGGAEGVGTVARRFWVELGERHLQAAHEALQSYARALHGDATVFQALMQAGRIVGADGSAVDEAGLSAAQSHGLHINELCAGAPSTGHCAAHEAAGTTTEDLVLLGELARAMASLTTIRLNSLWTFKTDPSDEKVPAREDAEAVVSGHSNGSVDAWIADVLKELPKNCLVVARSGSFAAITPHEKDESLLVVGESSSLQTAVHKARLRLTAGPVPVLDF